jgi:hypothetical protein
MFDCQYEIVEFYVDGKFFMEKMLKNYERYLSNLGLDYMEKWMPTVKKSVEKCTELS